MTKYSVDFSYLLPEFGSVEVEANNIDDARDLAIEYAEETFEDIEDLVVTDIREII